MRAGTQTLIQALQALPWMTADNDDESNALSPMDMSSDDEDQRPQCKNPEQHHSANYLHTLPSVQLSSSIHTIHRPLARSRRLSIPDLPKHGIQAHSAVIEEELAPDDTVVSDEEIEPDFEDTSHPSTERPPLLSHQFIPPSTPVETHDSTLFKSMMTRTGSMATVKLHRRARLAEKLRDIYELDDIQEVWAGKFFSHLCGIIFINI
jgi:sterol 3beta-glucosyltransferase